MSGFKPVQSPQSKKTREIENDKDKEDQPPILLDARSVIFSIFDEFESAEESDQSNSTIFFYPDISQTNKALYGGMLSQVTNSINDYFSTTSDRRSIFVDYVVLNHHTIAYKAVGTYTLYLLAPNFLANSINPNLPQPLPPTTIQMLLEYFYKSFCFYCRSFQDIRSSPDNHKQMKDIMSNVAKSITDNILNNRTKSFQPMPYIPLPPGSNKTFVKASELIHNIIFPDHLGGAIFVKDNLLYTNIELGPTKLILDHIKRFREKQPVGKDPIDDSLTVYISPEDYNKMAVYKSEYTGNAEQLIAPGDNSAEPSVNFVAVDLLLVVWQSISIAVLSKEILHQSNRYLNKIKYHTATVEQMERDPSLQNPPIQSDTTISPSNNYSYHYFSYNDLNEQAISSGMATDVETIFISTCSSIHDTFERDPNITQMYLKNQQSEIFCKKQNGHEIYYQPKDSSRFINECETTVQKALRENHNINIM